MITIVEGIIWSRIVGLNDFTPLIAALTFPVPGAKYSRAYQSGAWNGTTCMLDRRSFPPAFPAGLTSRAWFALERAGHKVSVRPATRLVGTPYAEKLRGIDLYPHQVAAADALISAGRASLKAATGSGKTEIGAEAVRRLGLRTLWVTHTLDIFSQTIERLRERLGLPVIGARGNGCRVDAPVTVGMVSTLKKIADQTWWRQWEVLILDETHHASAATWYDVACRCTRALWRFGLSATPLTRVPLKNARLEAATGPLITSVDVDGEQVELSVNRLADGGFLARPLVIVLVPADVKCYPTYEEVREAVLPDWRRDPRRLRKLGGKLYAEMYRRGIVRNQDRATTIRRVVHRHVAAGDKVLVLCTLREHGQRLLLDLRNTIADSWWLCGTDSSKVRKETLSAFRREVAGAVLIASEIYREGVDIPEVDALFLAGAGESDTALQQRVGRALRPRQDKPYVLIYDVRDGRSPKLPKDYLARHSAERESTYRAQGWEIQYGS